MVKRFFVTDEIIYVAEVEPLIDDGNLTTTEAPVMTLVPNPTTPLPTDTTTAQTITTITVTSITPTTASTTTTTARLTRIEQLILNLDLVNKRVDDKHAECNTTAIDNDRRRDQLDDKLIKMVELCGQVKLGNVTDVDTLSSKPCKQRKSIKTKRDKLEVKEVKCMNRVATMMGKAIRLQGKIASHNEGWF